MMRRMNEWTFLVKYPVSLAWLWHRLGQVLGSPDPIGTWLWSGLFVVGIGVAATAIGGARLVRGNRPILNSSLLFAALALTAAVPAYALFLLTLHYYTRPWYYITLGIVVAAGLEAIFGSSEFGLRPTLRLLLRALRVLVAVVLLSLVLIPAWQEMPVRHTNIDLIAARLRLATVKDDVVVTSHWQYAVSLCRYYKGPARVITLPPINDHRFHRYDLALQQMLTKHPLEPAFSAMEAALRTGHRVFLVGEIVFLQPGTPAPPLSLGYRDRSGINHGGNYEVVWPIYAGCFAEEHAKSCLRVPVPVPNRAPIQPDEHLSLWAIEGWR